MRPSSSRRGERTVPEIRTKRWNEPAEPGEGTRIFVARYRPRYLRKGQEPWSLWLKNLAPSRELHAAFYGKRGQRPITFCEYVRRYRKEMRAQTEAIRDLARRLLQGASLTLLCYCSTPARCHRSLLKDMIERAAAELAGGPRTLSDDRRGKELTAPS
jgi:uncharacterized protein YeaO (DUF488 family)